ncbi:MAG: aldehyde dehydrogenase family protein [Pseudomonadales bacterium]
MTIDGIAVAAAKQLDVINPSTATVLSTAPDASPAEIDLAVDAAARAYPAWSGLPMATRRTAIMALADALEANRDELTLINSLECGAPLKVARSVDVAIRYLRTIAAFELPVEILREDATQRIELMRVSLGVVAAITPWNAPLTLAAAKIASALLVGNTMVLKPSPFAPLATLRLGQLASEIFPAGVLNVVSGGAAAGESLTGHPDVAKVSFTGSVEVGKHIMSAASGGLKRLTLELGGNDAAIVLSDTDPVVAAAGIARIAFSNCGQFCMAIKRVYVERPVAEALCDALVREVSAKRLGSALDPGTDIGPVQNEQQYLRLQALLEDTKAAGGRFLLGGGIGEVSTGGGYYISPAIVTGLDETAELVANEQFGPVLPVLVVDSAEEALARANASRFGLGGSVWGADVARATALARQMQVGTAWVNQHGALDAAVPMNGCKESGLGIEYGIDGLKGYTAPRVVNILKTTR